MPTMFKEITDFILKDKYPIHNKVVLFFVAFSILIIVNHFFGFTYFYFNDHKIEQIKSLNEIVTDTAFSKEIRDFALEKQNKLIIKNNHFDYVDSFIDIYFNQLKPAEGYKKYNSLLLLITTSGLFIFFTFILSLAPLFNQNISLSRAFYRIIFLSFFCIFLFFILLQIPVLMTGRFIWNYVINLVVQGILFYLMVIKSNK